MSKDNVKKFLAALSKEDYVEADKQFPSVVNDALQNCINKGKAKVVDEINVAANKIAAEAATMNGPEGSQK